jgi:hypothetical protein
MPVNSRGATPITVSSFARALDITPQTPLNLQQRILTMMLKTPEATASGATAPMFDPAIEEMTWQQCLHWPFMPAQRRFSMLRT